MVCISLMPLVLTVDPIPLITDANGVVRIQGTRVTLDTVVTAFLEGATAEEILEQYPSLQLTQLLFQTLLGLSQLNNSPTLNFKSALNSGVGSNCSGSCKNIGC